MRYLYYFLHPLKLFYSFIHFHLDNNNNNNNNSNNQLNCFILFGSDYLNLNSLASNNKFAQLSFGRAEYRRENGERRTNLTLRRFHGTWLMSFGLFLFLEMGGFTEHGVCHLCYAASTWLSSVFLGHV